MPVSRNPNQEYTSEYLSDVELPDPAIQIRDEDGNLVDVGGDNPLPVSQTDDLKTRTEDLDDKLARVVSLLEKLCIYAESITEIGMEGIEEDADY